MTRMLKVFLFHLKINIIMAHELDHSKGKAAFMSVNKKAWHGLGTIIDGQPQYDEILSLSGLDYIVEKKPNIHRINENEEIESDDSFFTYRTDVNLVLGSHVGSRYTIMQNSDALGVTEALLKSGQLVIETAGAIKEGRTSFITLKSKKPIVIDSKDIVDNYLLIMNSFDGSLPISILFTPVRVVCNNTLQMALKNCTDRINIRHTANGINRLEEAKRTLLKLNENSDNFQLTAQTLKKTNWDKAKFFDYIANLYCTKPEIKEIQSGVHPFEALSTRKTNVIKDVIEFAHTGVGQKEANEGSAWWAYNAITGYVAAKDAKNGEDRFNKMLNGSDKELMGRALKLAATPSMPSLSFAMN